ncbi:phosphonate metabolism protein/1,5-bisphosphokinase (PRPP-forming) PhnN [Propylenella binzhouense]|uniref:Ribose 1,5-bisphosphate phosphokinase PhnN n=1 Tax=Propylenella binzhouense TaxID=2555902 RepID=A0A964T8H7_9HYPH|nr:phosphonate metabolism protein/1,5-bisphosphokinase (PRPP-forming) PhnN [Propylenella binzhouense]MYZ50501.1 phosphonate metabolism protein/1,5-bisphosphokinase (PRPP-forming) PhnN [Propylenella binzhouense]
MARGTLVLVVGPSGAGKDTLIDYCRQRLPTGSGIVFARRVVTRAAQAGSEDHATLAETAFETGVAEGAFALHWHAHGLRYGIPAEIEDCLASGRSVVANVSRAAIPEARRSFRPLLVVSVTAPRAVLAERLAGRARESRGEIAERLGRADAYEVSGADVVRIDNSGPVERAGEALLALLTGRSPPVADAGQECAAG